MAEPLPTDQGYAWWDPDLSLKDTLRALSASMDDFDQDTARQSILLGNVIVEFRSAIARLSARCDRIEAALNESGRRPVSSRPSQATQLSDFSDGCRPDEVRVR